MRITQIADELESLQADMNSGSGVTCIKTVILYLRREEVDRAVGCCLNEWDKIRTYPDIADFLIDHVLPVNPNKI